MSLSPRHRLAAIALVCSLCAVTLGAQSHDPPTNLAATVSGQSVRLTWSPPTGALVSGYQLEAGSAPTLANLAAVPLSGTALSYSVGGVAPGTYFVRVRAIAGGVAGPPSNEVQVVITGPCVAAPGAPAALSALVAGSTVALSWQAASGPCAVTDYVIEAGSAPGLANLATLSVGPGTTLSVQAPAGTYHVRARALSNTAAGPPSSDVVVTVGPTCAPPGQPAWTVYTQGQRLNIDWNWPAAGPPASSYVLTAGDTPTAAGLAAFPFGGYVRSFSATAPSGTYYLKLAAQNGCGVTETLPMAVRFGRSYAGLSQSELLAEFGHPASRGPMKVFSTIGQEFSDLHADHGLLTWNYFDSVFAGSVGQRTEMYYTTDLNLYAAIAAFCPTTVIPGARNVTTCWEPVEGIYKWVVVPYTSPDFGTQLHELSHSFVYGTYPAAEAFPWLKEGSGMYYESGYFAGTTLVVDRPLPYLITNFRRHHGRGELLPLATLVTRPRDVFYGSTPTLVYSQAGMFWYYLAKQQPAVVAELIARLNNRSLANNDEVLAFIAQATGMNLAQLDAAYTAYALSW